MGLRSAASARSVGFGPVGERGHVVSVALLCGTQTHSTTPKHMVLKALLTEHSWLLRGGLEVVSCLSLCVP